MLTDSFTRETNQDVDLGSTRILLVDDHPMVREGIKITLQKQEGFDVVGEVGDGPSALTAVQQLQPEVIVLDHRLPGKNGLSVAAEILQKFPDTHIIMMSMCSDEAYVGHALRLGAHGYVVKSADSGELVKAIHSVVRGQIYLSPPHDTASIAQYQERARSVPFDVWKTLTPREKQVSNLIVLGKRSNEIARQLKISDRTVETHRANIKKKFGASSMAEMVRLILENRDDD